jgi:DNA processing protein
VLGCGVDRDYPRANAGLAARVAAHGAVLSEYEPGTPPAPWRFPARNRIVAALAQAVVVVEASARSGALITAALALDLGRDVLAVPGTPWHGGHAGQNGLLRDGAAPVTSVEDVLVALGLDPAELRRDDPALGAVGARVLAAVRRLPATPEVLAHRVGLTPAALSAALVELELAGAIARERDGTVVSA